MRRVSPLLGRVVDTRDQAKVEYSLQSTFFPHGLGAEVGVAPSTVPVARNGLWVKAGNDAKVFTHPVQDESRHPQVVTHVNAVARPNLILPLYNVGKY